MGREGRIKNIDLPFTLGQAYMYFNALLVYLPSYNMPIMYYTTEKRLRVREPAL